MRKKNVNAKMLRTAGFRLSQEDSWHNQIWSRGDIIVAAGNKRMSLDTLIEHVILFTASTVRRKIRIEFDKLNVKN
jgi:hypothetical protein